MADLVQRGEKVLILTHAELVTIKQALQYTVSNEHRGTVADRAEKLLADIKSQQGLR